MRVPRGSRADLAAARARTRCLRAGPACVLARRWSGATGPIPRSWIGGTGVFNFRVAAAVYAAAASAAAGGGGEGE